MVGYIYVWIYIYICIYICIYIYIYIKRERERERERERDPYIYVYIYVIYRYIDLDLYIYGERPRGSTYSLMAGLPPLCLHEICEGHFSPTDDRPKLGISEGEVCWPLQDIAITNIVSHVLQYRMVGGEHFIAR